MYIDKDELLSRTNGGLDIIFDYYPQAREAHQSGKTDFKLRDEKTASARLKRQPDGNWVVTDFGDDSIPRNGILVCMKEENLEFREALVLLAGKYGVEGVKPVDPPKPEIRKRDAKPDEKEGEYFFEIKEEIPDHELEILGPKLNKGHLVTNEVCKALNFVSLESFTYIKNRQAVITRSTEKYPIFMLDEGEFKKIYQPLSFDKKFKFWYVGKRPKDYVNGLKQLEAAYEKYCKDQKREKTEEEIEKGFTYEKLGEAILASGERDALNVKGMGIHVVWQNSETAKLSNKNYRSIMKCVDTLYVLPDIDATGKKAAVELGLEYNDIKIIWLPEKLSKFKDRRGNPRKDFRDYVELYPDRKRFHQLMNVAMPLRYWDKEMRKEGPKYFFNNEQAYNFLYANGFSRIENKNLKEGFMFVKVDGHTVWEIKAYEAKEYLLDYTKRKYLPIDLRNLLHRSSQLSEGALAGLPKTDIDFTDFTREEQCLFFENATWIIDKKGVREYKPGEVQRYVWKEEVVPHKVKLLDEPFKLKLDKERGWDIEVLNDESYFFRFLINASRMYWRKELEDHVEELDENKQKQYLTENHWKIDGKLLDPEEIWEQKQHLINKIFAIGYLLHRYKDPSKPWCVYAMDNKDADVSASHGGSGKSVAFKAVRNFMKSVTLNGRNPRLTENPHIYDRVNEHTDFLLIDDADPYLNFQFFFDALTGEMNINPKNNQSYEIPFKDAPKFCITTNFALRNIDPSTERRILYAVFSDYYHIKGENTDFRENRTIRDDFGINLFDDYDENDWNNDINFFAFCIKAYLTINKKFNPPMQNVMMRNLRIEMTDTFKDWADSYFHVDSGRLNDKLVKSEVFEAFLHESGVRKWSSNKFGKAIRAWAKYNGYEFNPKEMCNNDGRIIGKVNGKAEEQIFIKAPDVEVPEEADPDLIMGNSREDAKPL